MIGNCAGRTAHVYVGETRHGLNLFAGIVGKSSRSRKGTSAAPADRVLALVDPMWRQTRQIGGLGSGEGLIWAIRVMRPNRRRIAKARR